MSLVETALKKLQQSAREARPLDASAVARAPVAQERAVATVGVPRGPRRRRSPSDVVPQHAPIKVDRAQLRAAGLLAPEDQERQIADQFRQIKRPLIANAAGRGAKKVPNGHLIMTASALPNEGKTFTSINLALSLALEKDITVLLVDADVAKRHISRIFGVDKEPGLLDALKDDTLDLESLIVPDRHPGPEHPAGRQSHQHRHRAAVECAHGAHRRAARRAQPEPHRAARFAAAAVDQRVARDRGHGRPGRRGRECAAPRRNRRCSTRSATSPPTSRWASFSTSATCAPPKAITTATGRTAKPTDDAAARRADDQ